MKYDVICVTKTWGSSQIPDSLLLDGSFYSIVRCDRVGRPGGGVCIFIKSCLKYKCVKIQPVPNIDIVCIDLLGFENKYRFVNCYVPPRSCSVTEIHLKEFVTTIESVFTCDAGTDASIIFTGDFNFPNIDWSVHDLMSVENSHCSYSSIFCDFIQRRSLLQSVTSPTRNNNILDLVF